MIIYNGKNSRLDFDLYIASKDVPAPTRKTITETVPYMSGVYDFSFHDGDIDEYDALKIKYSFDVIGDSKADLSKQKKLLLNWIYSRGDQRLYDLAISKNEYYEVYHATPSWSESGLQGLLTVEFLCYPFRKTELLTYSHTLYTTIEQEITLVNEGDRKVIPKIELTTKNLFDVSLVKATDNADIYISKVSFDYIFIATTKAYTGDGRADTGITLKQFCALMKAGEAYTLNAKSLASNKAIYLNGADVTWNFGQSLVITQEMLDSTVCFYGYNSASGRYGESTVGEIQIERGKTATEYTPYIGEGIAANIKYGENSLAISAGNYDGLFVLEKGENKFVVSGKGTLFIEYFAEVLG